MKKETISALEAQYEAQKIAFAPVIFQVVRTMREFGILKLLSTHKKGLILEGISKQSGISIYGVKVLLESAVGASVILVEDERYYLSKIGYFLENDKMTRINMDYNHYVNYHGLYDLDKSIKESRPVGLQVFGDWDSIYPHLSTLPDNTKKAWFDFTHFYSDSVFDDAIDIIKKSGAKRLLDIGGNTGKFSIRLFILEPILDRQQHKTGSYCITHTSPYFTAMANGCSKMFNTKDLFAYIRKAGLEIEECYDDLGFSHSLVKCKKV